MQSTMLNGTELGQKKNPTNQQNIPQPSLKSENLDYA